MSDPAAGTPPAAAQPAAPAPVQPAAPAPVPQPAPQPAQPSAPPADWQGPASAWHDLDKARTKAREANAALEAERAKVAEITNRATALEQEAARLSAMYKRDTTLLDPTLSMPETFRHPRMRERIWDEYQAHVRAQGDQALEFAAFVPTLKDDPLYGAHFAQTVDPSAVPALPQVPNPANPAPQVPATGNVQVPGGNPVAYTDAMIQRLKAEGHWRAGRINTATGEPIGGSAHWQAHMRALANQSRR